VFLNRWEFIVDLHTRMQERGIVPEYEIFDWASSPRCSGCSDKYGLPAGGHVHVDLVMGRAGRDAGHGRPALVAVRAGDPGPARGHHVLGHRHRPQHRFRYAGVAVGGRSPAGRDGDTITYAKGSRSSRTCSCRARAPGYRPARPAPPLTTTEARELLGVAR
jgi:hypothetical protein